MDRPTATHPLDSDIFGLVLAGGRARRMGGGDKPLLTLGGRPMLAHVLDRLLPQCPVGLSIRGDAARWASFGCPVIPDASDEDIGPLAGILAGLRYVDRTDRNWLLTVPGDTPFLPFDLLTRLQAVRRSERIPLVRAASGSRAHPAVALWPVALLPTLELLVDRGLRALGAIQDTYMVAEAVWATDPFDPFHNVNTPADLALAEDWLALTSSGS